MLALLLQAAAVPTDEQLQQLQRAVEQAQTQAGVTQTAVPTANAVNTLLAGQAAGAAGGMGALAGNFIFASLILMIVMIVLMVINLMNVYHWGMTDKAGFMAANEDKKKWFKILVLVPVICGLISIIPFVGWVVGAIGFIYWIVMSLKYFFSLRKTIR